MDRIEIIEAIRRIAVANGGKAPGSEAFERKTGLRKSEWYPHLWLRWGDVLVEAGFAPNKLQTAISTDVLISSYIALARELGHLPVEGEMRRKARADKLFASHSAFARLGGKEKLLEAVLQHCQKRVGPTLKQTAPSVLKRTGIDALKQSAVKASGLTYRQMM